jgi:hypothetical protein
MDRSIGRGTQTGQDVFPYRSLSSVGRVLLPMAEEMHSRGVPWRDVAEQLKVSLSALYIWRRLKRTDQSLSQNRT